MTYTPVYPAIRRVIYTNDGAANSTQSNFDSNTKTSAATPTYTRTVTAPTSVFYTDSGQTEFGAALTAGLTRNGPVTPNFNP